MPDRVESLLEELIALTRQQLTNQETLLDRQAQFAARVRRRTWTSWILWVVVLLIAVYVVQVTSSVRH